VREDRDIYAICVYCQKPIYRGELPCKGLDGDRKAHLTCWLDHKDEQIEPLKPDPDPPKS